MKDEPRWLPLRRQAYEVGSMIAVPRLINVNRGPEEYFEVKTYICVEQRRPSLVLG